MSKRLKRPPSKIQMAKRVIAISLCILLPIGGFFGYTRVKDFYEEKIKVIRDEMSGYTVTAYEAVEDIKAGEIITNEMVKSKKTLSGQKQGSFMTTEDIGSQALVDIPKDTQLLKNMFQKNAIDDTLRELEFSLNIAGRNIKQGDYTDIRLRYPDGEDYIVLSKIYISRIDWEKGYLYFNLSPEEIHLISSALVDCYIRSGSYLYTTRYIAASYQEPSFVTYIPNTDVQKLIQKDPNIVEKARNFFNESDRRDLEERLENYYGQYASEQTDVYTETYNTAENTVNDPLYYINGKDNSQEQSASEATEDTNGEKAEDGQSGEKDSSGEDQEVNYAE